MGATYVAQTVVEHPAAAAVVAASVAVLAAVVVLAALRGITAARRAARRRRGEKRGAGAPAWTMIGAAIATAVAADGMWATFSDVGMPSWLRVVTFAFLEVLVIQSAVRARQSMRDNYRAGVDGAAMWVLTAVSALLSAAHAVADGPFAVVLVRAVAPFAAAYGWERSMALERRRRLGRSSINWTVTPERILTRLGLADPTDRTASDVAKQRRLLDVALAADDARTKRTERKQKRLKRAMRRAVEAGALIAPSSGDGIDLLLAEIDLLYATGDLLDRQAIAPWTQSSSSTPTAEEDCEEAGEEDAPLSGDPAVIEDVHRDLSTRLSSPLTFAEIRRSLPQMVERVPAQKAGGQGGDPEGAMVLSAPAGPPRLRSIATAQSPAESPQGSPSFVTFRERTGWDWLGDSEDPLEGDSQETEETADGEDGGKPTLADLFVQALADVGGDVSAARERLEQMGRPVGRSYAYRLRAAWAEQAAAS